MAEMNSAMRGAAPRPAAVKLGRNVTGYRGVTVNMDAVLTESVEAARRHGWQVDPIGGEAHPGLVALTRVTGLPVSARVYLSAGIHGDEPAPPLAIRDLLVLNRWPQNLDLWICPCLNPEGFALNRRENGQGIDLNRDYRGPKSEETKAHIQWLARQSAFDLCLCLHEDWESHGFYVYELNPDGLPSLGQAILASVAGVCPIDHSEVIEGRAAREGLIRPAVDPRSRPDWPEAFYLTTHKARLSYTLEAPSDFTLEIRVAALKAAVTCALRTLTVLKAR